MPDPMEQLRRNYAGMVDDELLDLASAADDLTDEAREALFAELDRRDLSAEEAAPAPEPPRAPDLPHPAMADANWSVVPGAPRELLESEWVAVSSTDSETEARETQELLRASGIESQLQIVVLTNQADAGRAFEVLSEQLDRDTES